MDTVNTNKELQFALTPTGQLGEGQRMAMLRLMQENYDHVHADQFMFDLSLKQFVGLLLDQHQIVRGFTTYAVIPGEAGFNIIFSGDTVIDPEYWGSQALIKGGVKAAGQIAALEPSKSWYWFLISKGHRTYLYLPLFFEQYFPALEPERHVEEFQGIIADYAQQLFGENWLPEKGIIRFPESHGQLKPELAAATWEKQNNSHVRFFTHLNPGFEQGDELACMTELHPDNMRGFAKRAFLEGLLEPVGE